MDEQQLAKIEALHPKPEGTHGRCEGCGYECFWPCDAVTLLAEVRRLQEENDDRRAVMESMGLIILSKEPRR